MQTYGIELLDPIFELESITAPKELVDIDKTIIIVKRNIRFFLMFFNL